MTRANTTFDRLRGRNDAQRTRIVRFSGTTVAGNEMETSDTSPVDGVDVAGALFTASSVSGATTYSCGLTADAPNNSTSKQVRHTPRALTGVVHLLYFLPQVL